MVGQNIAHYRKRAGHTIRSLAAEMTRTGHHMSHSVISQMENGQRRIDVDELVTVAAYIDASAAALLAPTVYTDEDGTRPVEPEDTLGDAFNPDATAGEIVARNFTLPPGQPDWIPEAIGNRTGLRWRYEHQALQTIDQLRAAMGTDDVELLLNVAAGTITREQQRHESPARGND